MLLELNQFVETPLALPVTGKAEYVEGCQVCQIHCGCLAWCTGACDSVDFSPEIWLHQRAVGALQAQSGDRGDRFQV